MNPKFTKGQTVFYERRTNYSSESRPLLPCVISKVGRVWVYFSSVANAWRQDRFAIDDMRVDGKEYSSPGRIWLSEEEYRESIKKDGLRAKITLLVAGPALFGMSVEGLEKIIELLEVKA